MCVIYIYNNKKEYLLVVVVVVVVVCTKHHHHDGWRARVSTTTMYIWRYMYEA